MTHIAKQEIEQIAEAALPWERLRGATVLITGGTGFIGSFLIHALMRKNETDGLQLRVLALVRNEESARAMFGAYERAGRLSFIVQDVCAPLETAERADYIIHCASNAAPREYSLYPVETMKTNFLGTLHLLDYARRAECRSFLYVSTIEVYGTSDRCTPFTEADYGTIDAMKVRSCYPLSKKGCETLAVSYFEEYGVPAKVGRLSYIFGPGMKPGDSKVAAVFPKCIAEGKDIVLKSEGAQLRSYTYIRDAVTGLLTVLLAGEDGECYNIASSQCTTTIAGMAKTLVEAYPERGLQVRFELPTDQEKKGFSLIGNAVLEAKKLEELGWRPEVELRSGLKKVVEEQEELLKGTNNA